MDPNTPGPGVVADVKSFRLEDLAEPNCSDCFGRGYNGSLVVSAGQEPQRLVCNCVIRSAKKNPALAFEFLKAIGGVH